MDTAQKVEDFEQIIEKIVFDEGELAELKIAVRNFNKGEITPKQLKQYLLQYRGRMVKDVSNYLTYYLNRARDKGHTPVNREFTNSTQSDLASDQLRQKLAERDELLEIVGKKINSLVPRVKNELKTVF